MMIPVFRKNESRKVSLRPGQAINSANTGAATTVPRARAPRPGPIGPLS